jgi:hypothetical protein
MLTVKGNCERINVFVPSFAHGVSLDTLAEGTKKR